MVRDIKAVPKLAPKKEAVPWESLPLDKLLAHIAVFKEQLFTQLRNTVLDTAKQARMQNIMLFHFPFITLLLGSR